jgi:hypothetical protein
LIGGAMALVVPIWWLISGANRGWTMNRVPVVQIDEITEIQYTTYEERLVPGIEFLGGALLFALILIGISFFPRSKRNSSRSHP